MPSVIGLDGRLLTIRLNYSGFARELIIALIEEQTLPLKLALPLALNVHFKLLDGH